MESYLLITVILLFMFHRMITSKEISGQKGGTSGFDNYFGYSQIFEEGIMFLAAQTKLRLLGLYMCSLSH